MSGVNYEYRVINLCFKVDNGYQVIQYGPRTSGNANGFYIRLRCGDNVSNGRPTNYNPTFTPNSNGQTGGDRIDAAKTYAWKVNSMTTTTVQWTDPRSDADGYNDAMTALAETYERCGLYRQRLCYTGVTSSTTST